MLGGFSLPNSTKSAETTDLDHLEPEHYLECWKQIFERIEILGNTSAVPQDSESIPRTIDDRDKMVRCDLEAIRYHRECGNLGEERMRGAGGSMGHCVLCHPMANQSCFCRLLRPVWIV
jgi:hypothetical protein